MHRPRSHLRELDPASARRRVTKMLKGGRVTAEEADRVFNASDAAELERAVGEIRLRHARAKLDADVRQGRMTRDEADLVIQRIQQGEHPRLPSRFGRRTLDDGGG